MFGVIRQGGQHALPRVERANKYVHDHATHHSHIEVLVSVEEDKLNLEYVLEEYVQVG